MKVTRYAIRFNDTNEPELSHWHCQGLPDEMSFGNAILFPNLEKAEEARRRITKRHAGYINLKGCSIDVVEVVCEFSI